jgi:hypothetical protein
VLHVRARWCKRFRPPQSLCERDRLLDLSAYLLRLQGMVVNQVLIRISDVAGGVLERRLVSVASCKDLRADSNGATLTVERHPVLTA